MFFNLKIQAMEEAWNRLGVTPGTVGEQILDMGSDESVSLITFLAKAWNGYEKPENVIVRYFA